MAKGDYLEAEAVEQGILLKPVTVVERKQAWQQLFAAAKTVKPHKPTNKKGANKEEQAIATMVKDYRKQP